MSCSRSNHPAAGNAGFTPWSLIEHYLPGVAEPGRLTISTV